MSQNFTYSELLAVVPSYMERQDAAFLAQIPTFVSLAENRIATDMKQQGFQSVVKGTLDATAVMAKPAFWRETISFTYNLAGKATPVELRALEYLKAYWPDASITGSPKYYADYNIANFLIAPTPAAAYTFELVYYARLQPLTEANQVNWITLNAPQALLYAVLLEASLWAKAVGNIQTWQTQYDSAKGGLLAENAERLSDRNTVVTRA